MSDPPKAKKSRTKKLKVEPKQDQEARAETSSTETTPMPTEVNALERPHRPTWFLPGKVGRVPVQILVDTGCTTNLMSRTIFEKLDKNTRESMEPCESFGTMANGARLEFFGLVKTTLKVRHFTTEETFVVGQSDEDIILGMSFLMKHDCSIDFRRGTLELQGKRLTCTDRQGIPMAYKVQVYREVELPPGREMTVAG